MGIKKMMMRYGDDDSSGYRVQSSRRNKIENRKGDPSIPRAQQRANNRLADSFSSRSLGRPYHRGDYTASSNKAVDEIKLSKKKEKNLMKARNKQRRDKYEISTSEEIDGSIDQQNHGKQEDQCKSLPISPTRLRLENTRARSKEKKACFQLMPSDPTVNVTTCISSHIGSDDDRSLTGDTKTAVNDGFTASAKAIEVVHEQHEDSLVHEVSILSRCGEVLYSILFPNPQYTGAGYPHSAAAHYHNFPRPYNRFSLGWEDDSDDEENETVSVSKAWFVQRFLDLVKDTRIAKDSILDARSKINLPCSHKILTVVTKRFVTEHFLLSSDLFISSMISELFVHTADADNRDYTCILAVIQAAYRRCDGDKVKVQRDILVKIYDSLSQYDLSLSSPTPMMTTITSSRDDVFLGSSYGAIFSLVDVIQNLLTIETKTTADGDHLSFKTDAFIKIFSKIFRSYIHDHGCTDNLSMGADGRATSILTSLQLILQWIQLQSSEASALIDRLLRELLRSSWKMSTQGNILLIDALIMVLSNNQLELHVWLGITKAEEHSPPMLSLPKLKPSAMIERSIHRLSEMIISSHFKVAQHAIAVTCTGKQSSALREKYLISNDEDSRVISELKARFMQKFVHSLHLSESHWHASVRHAAAMHNMTNY
jgi:hypothetical protein